jgi:hypothetical protein
MPTTLARTRLRVLTGSEELPSLSPARAALSLHCHTHHSQEILDFIPHYAARIPVVAALFQHEMKRYETRHGKPIDFTRAWWTPPVSAHEVWEAETRQIEERLQLQGFVSITDHDDIEAGTRLQVLDLKNPVPISMEWTVPFGLGYFHLGIHNLPREWATQYAEILLHFTRDPQSCTLSELLELLNEMPDVLVVLNHPLWDIENIGTERHNAALAEFMQRYGAWIHALEWNGFRSWKENQAVLKMGKELGFPVVSGGDRHGCQPNTTLNLTTTESFSAFVAEVRAGYSEVIVMPEYNEALLARTLEAAAEILREYPSFPREQQVWTDRVFARLESGAVKSLSTLWQRGGPVWVRSAVWMMCVLGSRRFRPALRLALLREGATS